MNMNLKSDFSRRTAALFFLLLLAIGLIAGLDYSKTTDEGTEYGILKANAAEYACRLLGENSAVARHLCADVGRISESVERDHGVSAYYIFYPFGVLLNRVSPYALSLGWHTYTFLWFMMGCIAAYSIARTLLKASRRFSCVAVLMLYTTPRMFAAGHYNNKDMILLALTLMIAAFGIRWICENRLRDGVCMAICGAFAMNTKILGGWCFGVMGIAYLVSHILNHALNRRAWRDGLIVIAAFFALYALLTPAMWGDPVGYAEYVVKYAKEFSRYHYPLLFEGRIYRIGSGDRIPWYYLIKMMAMSIPVYIQILALAGLIASVVCARSAARETAQPARLTLVVALIGILPLVYAMCSDMILYNGWRHFYFAYASVLTPAFYGLHTILNRAKKAVCIAIAAAMAVNCGAIVRAHPLEESTFNVLAAPFVHEDYETDYWLLAARVALERIAENGEKLNVTTNYSSSIVFANALEASPARLRDCAEFTWKCSAADCVIVWEMYHREEEGYTKEELEISAEALQLDADDLVAPGWNASGAFEEWFTIDALGNTVVTVYRRIK